MKKQYVLTIMLIVLILVVSVSVLVNYLLKPSSLKHETDRWAVIGDVNGDRIAVEPASDEVWSQLTRLQQNGSRMWVGSIVEHYNNEWGFRFKPENVTVAEVTAGGLQATIRHISENLSYWIDGWAYVSAKVTETHAP